MQTVYNPAVVESDPRFGVEGTLAQFDTQWTTNVLWQKNDHPVNLQLGRPGGSRAATGLAAQFQTQLAKTAATGDRVLRPQ